MFKKPHFGCVNLRIHVFLNWLEHISHCSHLKKKLTKNSNKQQKLNLLLLNCLSKFFANQWKAAKNIAYVPQ